MITWGTFVALACAVLAGLYFYNRVDEEIRALVETKFAELYPDLRVSVSSAKLIERRGFEVRGVSVSDPQHRGARPELLLAERISIACRPTIDDLIAGRLQVQSVTLRGVRLQIARTVDGDWNIKQLIRPPKMLLDPPPRIFIEGGVIEVVDSHQSPPALYTLHDVNLTLTPDLNASDAPRYQLEASFSGDHLQRSTLTGVVLPKEARFAVQGVVPRLLLSPELRQSLPQELAAPLTQLGNLRGGTSLRFVISRDAKPGCGWDFSADAKLLDGIAQDPRIPEPLTDVQAELHVDREGVDLRRFSARYGSALIEIASPSAATAEENVLEGSIHDLNVDMRFVSLLPEKFQKVWQDFQPRGLIDAKFRIQQSAEGWQPEIECLCRDATLEWRGFPVLCRSVQGPIHLTRHGVTFNLTATAQDEPITMVGQIMQPGPHWTGWVTLETNTPQTVSATVLTAIPAKAKPIIESLAPQGQITARVKFVREDPSAPPQREIDLQLVRLDVRHRSFPYPIRDITGQVICRDDVWYFQNLQGINDGAPITCEGNWQITAEGGRLVLNFRAKQVPLDDDLRQALPASTQRIWQQLRPRGVLDDVQVQLQHSASDGLTIDARGQQLPQVDGDELRSISLQPLAFPYRVEDITGSVRYRDGRVDFQQLRGVHGDTLVNTHGHAIIQPNGDWTLSFDELNVDRLNADRDLLNALPLSLSRAVDKLQLIGPAHLAGRLIFQQGAAPQSPLLAQWQMRTNVDHVHMNCGLPLRDVAGTVMLQGNSQDSQFFSRGQIELETATLNNIHISHIRGPIWFNDKEVRLGSWAESPSAPQHAERLTAKLFEGQLQADAQFMLDETGQFRLHADLTDASLLHTLRELTPTTNPVRGLTRASIQLAGTQAGAHSLQGRGDVQLTQANLYELPQILALLKSIRSGSVDRAAFDSGNLTFRIQGEHLYFDRIDLIGDSITLKGVGEMNTRREVNVDFYTIIGRENAYVPAMRKLFGMTNGRFLQIHVTGPLENPTMVREALPALNETLEQLFPESVSDVQLANRPEPLNSTSSNR